MDGILLLKHVSLGVSEVSIRAFMVVQQVEHGTRTRKA